jgi:hypothetical protein
MSSKCSIYCLREKLKKSGGIFKTLIHKGLDSANIIFHKKYKEFEK